MSSKSCRLTRLVLVLWNVSDHQRLDVRQVFDGIKDQMVMHVVHDHGEISRTV